MAMIPSTRIMASVVFQQAAIPEAGLVAGADCSVDATTHQAPISETGTVVAVGVGAVALPEPRPLQVLLA
jgi:hypothetical protein